MGVESDLDQTQAQLANEFSALAVVDARLYVADTGVETAGLQAAITAAAVIAAARPVVVRLYGLSVTVTNVTVASSNISIDLMGGQIVGRVDFAGTQFTPATGAASVTLAGAFAAFPVGTTTVAGNFAGFGIGDTVAISLTDAGSASFNQAGSDFVTVTAADGVGLTFTPATRFAYQNPKFESAQWVAVAGPIAAGASSAVPASVPAGWAAGDILRVENITGTDSVTGATAYFELIRVSSIVGTTIAFEDTLAYTYGNVKLVKVGAISDVGIGNGKVTTVVHTCCQNVITDNIRTARAAWSRCYNVTADKIVGNGDGTSTIVVNWTHCRHGAISNVRSRGARGSTDNGSIKSNQIIDFTFSNIQGWDDSATAQGVYPFFVDYSFVPYVGWNQNVVVNGLVAHVPKAGAALGVWLTGLRKCSVSNVSTAGIFRLSNCRETPVSGCNVAGFDLVDVTNCAIIGNTFNYLSAAGFTHAPIANNTILGSGGANSNRGIWLKAGTSNPTCARVPISHNVFSSADASEISIYLQSTATCRLDGNMDGGSGISSSVTIGSSVTGLTYGFNNFGTSVDTSATANAVPRLVIGNDQTFLAANTTGATTLQLTRSRRHRCTLTGNTTFSVAGAISGQDAEWYVIIVQAASGGPYTAAWSAAHDWGAAGAPTMPTGASAIMIVKCRSTNGGSSIHASVEWKT